MSLPLESPSGAAEPSDAELIAAVRSGRTEAYGLLYERHVDAVRMQVLQLATSPADADDLVAETFAAVFAMIKRGGGPHLAFRAYARTTARNRFYQRKREDRRLELSGDMRQHEVAQPWDDPAVAELDSVFAAAAFARLPERWQTVLWLTEVEQKSPADLAPLLGLSANSVSALAYRAREGLRQAYLQEHARSSGDAEHDFTLDRLGAWVRGRLRSEIGAKVGAHLARCARCQAVAAELNEVNGGLGALIAPVLLASGSAALVVEASASKAVAAAGSVGAGSVGAGSTAAGSVGAGPVAAGSVAAGSVAAGSVAVGPVAAGSVAAGSVAAGSAAAGTAGVTGASAGTAVGWLSGGLVGKSVAGVAAAMVIGGNALLAPTGARPSPAAEQVQAAPAVAADRFPSQPSGDRSYGTGPAAAKASKPVGSAGAAGKPAKTAKPGKTANTGQPARTGRPARTAPAGSAANAAEPARGTNSPEPAEAAGPAGTDAAEPADGRTSKPTAPADGKTSKPADDEPSRTATPAGGKAGKPAEQAEQAEPASATPDRPPMQQSTGAVASRNARADS